MTDILPRLEGERVAIEPFAVSDIGAAYVSWLNDPEVVRFSNQRFRAHTIESCQAYFASFADSPNLFVAVRDRADDRLVGTMTAYRTLHHGTVDIGIMIGDRRCWGAGFGQEAWDLLLGWLLALPDIRKATAGTLACNHGMVRLMERSAMTLEGVRVAQEIVEGVPQDIVLYGKFAA